MLEPTRGGLKAGLLKQRTTLPRCREARPVGALHLGLGYPPSRLWGTGHAGACRSALKAAVGGLGHIRLLRHAKKAEVRSLVCITVIRKPFVRAPSTYSRRLPLPTRCFSRASASSASANSRRTERQASPSSRSCRARSRSWSGGRSCNCAILHGSPSARRCPYGIPRMRFPTVIFAQAIARRAPPVSEHRQAAARIRPDRTRTAPPRRPSGIPV